MMKKSIVFSFLLLSITQLFANTYELKFTVKGLSNATVKLAYYFGDKQYVRDSVTTDATGKFVFTGQETLPGGVYMIVIPGNKYFEVILDTEQKFSGETDTLDLIQSMKIKGSTDNEQFYEYLKWIAAKGKQLESIRKELEVATNESEKQKLRDKQVALDKEVKAYKTNYMQANPQRLLSKIFNATNEPEIPEAPVLANGRKDSTFTYRYYKAHFFDNIDMKDDRLLRSPIMGNKLKQYTEKLTPQIPDSINAMADYLIGLTEPTSDMFKYLVYWITNTYEKSNIMGMDAVFVYMAKNYYLNGKAYWVEDAQLDKVKERVDALEPCLIGKVARNVRMFKPDFTQVSLHDVKADFTIVYFWDPSCGHCKKVTPKLQEFYSKSSKELSIEVFAVYIEADTTEWFKFIREKDLKWLNVADLTGVTNFRKYYDIYSTPVIYLLDKNKKIIGKRMDVEAIEEFIKNYSKKSKI